MSYLRGKLLKSRFDCTNRYERLKVSRASRETVKRAYLAYASIGRRSEYRLLSGSALRAPRFRLSKALPG